MGQRATAEEEAAAEEGSAEEAEEEAAAVEEALEEEAQAELEADQSVDAATALVQPQAHQPPALSLLRTAREARLWAEAEALLRLLRAVQAPRLSGAPAPPPPPPRPRTRTQIWPAPKPRTGSHRRGTSLTLTLTLTLTRSHLQGCTSCAPRAWSCPAWSC